MPLITALSLAIASGFSAAFAARVELRVSPRPALLTPAFFSYVLYLGLVLVPASAYFYIFHGDWFLLYSLNSDQIPSALALLGFVGEGVLGVAAFQGATSLVRAQRETSAALLASGFFLVAVAPLPLLIDRLRWVGTYAQYHRNFGLVPFGTGALLSGTLVVGGLVLSGLVILVVRLHLAAGRG